MVTAIETRPGTDPDRASFTTAPQAARDQLTAAPRIRPGGPAGLPGAAPPVIDQITQATERLSRWVTIVGCGHRARPR